MSDSQTLLKMAENIGSIAATVVAIKEKQDEHAAELKDAITSQNTRITSLEGSRSMVYGAMTFLTAIGAIMLKFITGKT